MNITPIKPQINIQKVGFPQSFGNNTNFIPNNPNDTFTFNNIHQINLSLYGDLEGVDFEKPVTPSVAFKNLHNAAKTNKNLFSLFTRRMRSVKGLATMSENLAKIPELNDIKLKKLFAMGISAYAFETEDGKVLKVTKNDHFNGREHKWFDLPIEKTGHYGDTYYYLEEKVSHDILPEEAKFFINEIKKSGYTLYDHLYIDDNFKTQINMEQFGKTSNGKIYLIDPECAYKRFRVITCFLKNLVKYFKQ